jgi:hypothetical protein
MDPQGHVTGGAHREFAMASGEMSDAEFLGFIAASIEAALPHLCSTESARSAGGRSLALLCVGHGTEVASAEMGVGWRGRSRCRQLPRRAVFGSVWEVERVVYIRFGRRAHSDRSLATRSPGPSESLTVSSAISTVDMVRPSPVISVARVPWYASVRTLPRSGFVHRPTPDQRIAEIPADRVRLANAAWVIEMKM